MSHTQQTAHTGTTGDTSSLPAAGRGLRLAGALAGVLAAAVALGVAELTAALLGRTSSPVIAVGGAFVDRTPGWLKEFAVRTFGENDKAVLIAGILVTVAVLAALVGAVAVRRTVVGYAGVAVLGVVAAAAALSRPDAGWLDTLPSLVGALFGAVALRILLLSMGPDRLSTSPDRLSTSPDRLSTGPDRLSTSPGWRGRPPSASAAASPSVSLPARLRDAVAMGDRKGELDRRRFLLTSAGTGAVAVLAGGVGRVALQRRLDVTASRDAVRLPAPASPAPPVPAAASLEVSGISPLFTPNRTFYRVDTALLVPQVSSEDWRLRVRGMVDREVEIGFQDLLGRPLIERDITMTCVSNEVGGGLVGSARWLGAPLADLLREAGVQRGATQLVSRSADSMTIGTPVDVVMDGRDAMLAVAMNGEPLRPEHGFPVRMVVPGLYGYVSACKWVVDLELTTFEAYDAYWVERGWDAKAMVKTSSRIDTPRPLATLRPGRVPVAGVAWAQHRGIAAVEVRVDGGDWQQARLAAPLSSDAWRQWVWEWDAGEPGNHTLEVRATDKSGETQPEERVPPFPGGSTGWHSVVVSVNA